MWTNWNWYVHDNPKLILCICGEPIMFVDNADNGVCHVNVWCYPDHQETSCFILVRLCAYEIDNSELCKHVSMPFLFNVGV